VYLTKAALNYYEGAVLKNAYGRCTGGPYVFECGYTGDRLKQSQLMTLTTLPSGEVRRTRTAQGFDAFGNVGASTYAPYYRERKVSEADFWAEFNATKASYGILDSDTCAWKSAETGGTVASGLDPGVGSCREHLAESFDLAAPSSSTPVGEPDVGSTGAVSGFADDSGPGCCECKPELPSCVDTASWTNNNALGCEEYAREGFCTNGAVSENWAVGSVWNHPEVNCCACGGGLSDSSCSDTAGWDNGVGPTCDTYVAERFCKGGEVLEPWATGADWKFPEQNCAYTNPSGDPLAPAVRRESF
jgi:hypothetical protein